MCVENTIRTESICGAIEDALKKASSDYEEIANRSQSGIAPLLDVKPKEDQIKCCLYCYLSRNGYDVHVEAAYGRNGTRCDLVAWKNGKATAIEIKTAWAGSKPWVTKPAYQIKGWCADVKKLRSHQQAGGCAEAYFILSLFWQEGSKEFKNLVKSIDDKLELIPEITCGPFQISWNGLTAFEHRVYKVT